MDIKKLVADFRPAILFLVKFLGLYAGLSILYSKGYLGWFNPNVDFMSHWIANQTAWVMNLFGIETAAYTWPGYARADLYIAGKAAVSVVEGCNGLAVMSLFVSFILAFSGDVKEKLKFIGWGLLFIHVVNIIRIFLLAVIAVRFERHLYYIQKHFFTTIIYVAVFILWYLWVNKVMKKAKAKANTAS